MTCEHEQTVVPGHGVRARGRFTTVSRRTKVGVTALVAVALTLTACGGPSKTDSGLKGSEAARRTVHLINAYPGITAVFAGLADNLIAQHSFPDRLKAVFPD